jgi:hypothetical protein
LALKKTGIFLNEGLDRQISFEVIAENRVFRAGLFGDQQRL